MIIAPLEQFQIVSILPLKLFDLDFFIINFLLINVLVLINIISIIYFNSFYKNYLKKVTFRFIANSWQKVFEFLSKMPTRLLFVTNTKKNEKIFSVISVLFNFILFNNNISPMWKIINNSVKYLESINKPRVISYSKEAKVKFYSFNQIYVSQFSINQRTNIVFSKANYSILLNQSFYHTDSPDQNYENLLRNVYRDIFETPELWHQCLKAFENKTKLNAFINKDPELTKEADKLVLSYFYLVSKLMRDNQKKNSINRISALTIPVEIERLQCLFIESAAARYYSVQKVSRSLDRFTSGIDGIAFLKLNDEYFQYKKEQLQGTRYSMSRKSTRVKKNLPKKAILTEEIKNKIKQGVSKHNNELKLTLFNKCNIKTYRKNYKSDTVKRVWIPKLQSTESRPLDIFTLRDRVLQTILHAAAHPIVEYQSDPHSFACRPNRRASNAIALLAGHLEQLGMRKSMQKELPIKVSKVNYKKFKGSRYRKKILQIIPNAKKRRREYLYQYYICGPNIPIKDQKTVTLPFQFLSNYRIINVEIFKCFENISHDVVLKTYPICNKYRYFIKAWLNASIYGPICSNSKTSIKKIPKAGINQGSIIGPSIINCVLDGLEKSIDNAFRKTKNSKYRRSRKELQIIEKYSGKKPADDRMPIRFLFLRFADNILILGKNTPETFETTLKILKKELKERGLDLKRKENFIFEFKPGASFNYLGFRFIYTNYKSKKLNRGRITRNNYMNPFQTVRRATSAKDRSGLLIIIEPQLFKDCCNRIRKILSRSNSTLSVNELIKQYNITVREIVNYFGLTRTTRNQLRYLDNLSYRFFRKLLLQKFSSAPKVHGLIRSKYYTTDWRVIGDKEKQLKTSDIKINGNIPLSSTRLNEATLKANVYLDKVKWDKYESDKIKQISKHKMLQHHELSLEEFRCLLAASQNWFCEICSKRLTNAELSTAKETEVDHFPAVHEIKSKIWHKILDDYGLSPNELLKEYKKNEGDKNLDRLIKDLTATEQILFKYWTSIKEMLNYRIVHKACNRNAANKAKKDSAKERKFIKSYSPSLLYKYYTKFSKLMSTKIRRTYELTEDQKKIIFKKSKT